MRTHADSLVVVEELFGFAELALEVEANSADEVEVRGLLAVLDDGDDEGKEEYQGYNDHCSKERKSP